MASQYVAIAKASFTATLLRPDPSLVGRDEIAHFHALLDDVVNNCTPSNIQKCKSWLSIHVVNSAGRSTAFGKYLAALSTSLGKPVNTPSQVVGTVSTEKPLVEKPSLKRKRLHLLYLLNDVFHHAKHHDGDLGVYSRLTSNLQPHLLTLFTLVASFDRGKNPKHLGKVEELLRLWGQQTYCSPEYIGKLQDAVKAASASEVDRSQSNIPLVEDSTSQKVPETNKEIPYIIPATHGDQSTPYYDLPAANMMPHIIPNSTRPIHPQLVKPLQFVSAPAAKNLVDAVKNLLKEVDMIYTTVTDEGAAGDIDEMGQRMVKDEVTGELTTTENYYGWSIDFCERIRTRREAKKQSSNEDARGGRSASRSDDRSLSPYKRRRSSTSSARGRGRSSSRGGYRPGQSRSRSPYNESRTAFQQTISRTDSRSRSSLDRRQHRSRSPINRPHLSSLPQPSLHLAPFQSGRPPLYTPTAQIDNPFPSQPPPAPIPPPPSAFNHNFPIGPGGLPIPPPPPFHTGPWPPPPPNMAAGLNYNPAQFPGFPNPGFVPPPPSPFHTSSGPAGPGLYGNSLMANSTQQQWQDQRRESGGQGQWHHGNEGRRGSGPEQWSAERDGRGARQWNQGNGTRGSGEWEQRSHGNDGRGGGRGQGGWDRGSGGRGGGGSNWNQSQDPRRRR